MWPCRFPLNKIKKIKPLDYLGLPKGSCSGIGGGNGVVAGLLKMGNGARANSSNGAFRWDSAAESSGRFAKVGYSGDTAQFSSEFFC